MAEEEVSEPTEQDRAAVIDACRRFAVEAWVKQFVLMMQLAAELFPEEIRTALGYVFDTRAVEEYLKTAEADAARVAAIVSEVQRLANEVAWQIEQIAADLSGRVDHLDQRLTRAAKVMSELAKRFNALAQRVTNQPQERRR
jgi:hypothetical protein